MVDQIYGPPELFSGDLYAELGGRSPLEFQGSLRCAGRTAFGQATSNRLIELDESEKCVAISVIRFGKGSDGKTRQGDQQKSSCEPSRWLP